MIPPRAGGDKENDDGLDRTRHHRPGRESVLQRDLTPVRRNSARLAMPIPLPR
jgi:hypothetical protein